MSQFVKYDGTSFPHDGTQRAKKEQLVALKFSLEGLISLINEYALYLKALFHLLGALF